MRTIALPVLVTILLLLLVLTPEAHAQGGYELTFSTYFGGDEWEHARDVYADADGNVYVCGGTASRDFPTTPGAYDRTFNFGDPSGEECDAFVCKFGPDGQLIWSTYLGGPGYDRAYGIEVDTEGYVYVAGRAGRGLPTTPGAFQPTFQGYSGGGYGGYQNGFVAKLSPDGSRLVWASYVGVAQLCRDIAIDDQGNAYVALQTSSTDYPVTRGVLQKAHGGDNTDCAVTKLSPAGSLLLSTYLGGSGTENADGIYVGSEGNVFVTGETRSMNFPVAAHAFQTQNHGGGEAFVALLSADFSRLLYSTYLGGPSYDNGRSGFLGNDGGLYVTGSSDGPGWPIIDEYQSTFKGGAGDWGNGDCILARLSPPSTITVDSSITYQTISGWEVVAFALEPGNPAFPNFRDTLFDLAVNDLGINRVRLEIRSGVENNSDNWSAYQSGAIDYATWRSRRYATTNDNSDPDTIDWSGFHFSEMDDAIDRIVNPLREVLAAKGERLIVNVNYVAFTGQITDGAYIHADAAEYAEFVLATYLHLQSKYGWVPDLWEVLLEPDNVSQWNGRLLGEAIAAVGERLRTAGFEPAFVAPSTTNMGNAVRYFDQMIQVPGVLPVLREISYHRYGGVSQQNLQSIAARAKQHGLDTAMLEWWNNNNGYATLHEDLKTGNNSAWEQGVLAGAMNSQTALCVVEDSNPARPQVRIGGKTKLLRQYYTFIRPGAIRVEATSQAGSFDPLAFINEDGGYAVVVRCDVGGRFSVGGLPAGTYGIKYATASEYDVDLPDQTLSPGRPAIAQIPQAGVLTIYGKTTTAPSAHR